MATVYLLDNAAVILTDDTGTFQLADFISPDPPPPPPPPTSSPPPKRGHGKQIHYHADRQFMR